MYLDVYIYIYIYIYISVYIYLYRYMSPYIYIYVSMYVYVYVNIFKHIYVVPARNTDPIGFGPYSHRESRACKIESFGRLTEPNSLKFQNVRRKVHGSDAPRRQFFLMFTSRWPLLQACSHIYRGEAFVFATVIVQWL